MSHYGCEKYSNLRCSDKWKMDLQVKKLKVDLFTTPRQNSLPGTYHHSLGNENAHSLQLRGRTMKTYFKMYCFKSTFLKDVTEE